MGDNDKPFVCPAAGCGRSFANEDHLLAHKAKHGITLPLKESHALNSLNFGVDETPTPTRFLRNCDELGLFQDDNPFDEQFRQASQSGVPESLPVDEAPEPLNTPHVPSTVSKNDKLLLPVSEMIQAPAPKFLASSSSKNAAEDASDSLPFNASLQTPLIEDDGLTAVSTTQIQMPTEETTFLNRVPAHSAVITLPATSVIQTPVITSVIKKGGVATNVTSSSSLPPRSGIVAGAQNPVIIQPTSMPPFSTAVKAQSTSNVQPEKPAATTILLPAASLVPSNSQVYQIIVKLADGQVIPQIPLTATTSTVVAPAGVARNGLQSQSAVKMKLKETILQTTKVSSNDLEVARTALTEVPVPLPAADSTTPPRGTSSRRQHRDQESDPDEKRKKQERNCAAAKRCRQRKKAWVQSLTQRAEKLEEQNIQLQTEVGALRNQVAQLKILLLAHKDCPVTLQQRAAGQSGVTEADVPADASVPVPSHNISILSAFGTNASSSPSTGARSSTVGTNEEYVLPLSVQVDVVTSENSSEMDLESSTNSVGASS